MDRSGVGSHRCLPVLVISAGLSAVTCASGCSDNRTPASAPEDDVVLACLPDLDGLLEADELPVVLDVSADYLVDRDILVDLAGDGGWSFDAAAQSSVSLTAHSITGAWYQDQFPGGQFAVVLSPGADPEALGIYSKDAQGLWLHGVASVDDTEGFQTVWHYQDPVAVLRFPLQVGDHWVEEGTVEDGIVQGSPYAAVDTYDIEVVADGRVSIPEASFEPGLRVSTRIETAPAVSGQTLVRWQDSFYFECFGEIVRAASRSGESERDFTQADSVLRLQL